MITGSYPPTPCGVGDYSYSLLEALASNPTIHVGVLTSKMLLSSVSENRVEIFPIIEYWGLIEIFKVIKLIWNWSPDIVHIQYPTQGYGERLLPWLLPLICFLMGKNVVQTWHEGYSRRLAPKLLLKSIVPSTLIFVRPEYENILHPHMRWAIWKKKSIFIQNASAIPLALIDEVAKATLKERYLENQKRLIVFFGFVLPLKGVELLFEIAEPTTDQIVIAGEMDRNDEYSNMILNFASNKPWLNKVTTTGFLPANDIAELLSVADAVVLPFRLGGGDWNTSIHGAVLNGAFVLTTSLSRNGYNKDKNIYFAEVDNIKELKSALDRYAGVRREYHHNLDKSEWLHIADKHIAIYEDLLRIN